MKFKSNIASQLFLINYTDRNLTTSISDINNYDWGKMRPDDNFNNILINSGNSYFANEDMNSNARSSWYNMTLTFTNGDVVNFKNDQRDATNGLAINPRSYYLDGPHAKYYNLTQLVAKSESKNVFTIRSNDSNFLNWMESVSSQKLLSQITMPGALKVASSNALVPHVGCEVASVRELLTRGIRFFELDCTEYGGIVYLTYGSIFEGCNVANIFKDCKAYLNEHPSETVILAVKNKGGDATLFTQALQLQLNEFKESFYTSSTMPNLGSVRGKIVLARRFASNDVNLGLNLMDGWQDNNAYFDMPNKANQKFTVQNLQIVANADEKWKAVNNLLDASASAQSTAMYINFCNISEANRSYYEINTAITQKLSNYFISAKRGNYYGVVLLDYPPNVLLKVTLLMIETNIT